MCLWVSVDEGEDGKSEDRVQVCLCVSVDACENEGRLCLCVSVCAYVCLSMRAKMGRDESIGVYVDACENVGACVSVCIYVCVCG